MAAARVGYWSGLELVLRVESSVVDNRGVVVGQTGRFGQLVGDLRQAEIGGGQVGRLVANCGQAVHRRLWTEAGWTRWV